MAVIEFRQQTKARPTLGHLVLTLIRAKQPLLDSGGTEQDYRTLCQRVIETFLNDPDNSAVIEQDNGNERDFTGSGHRIEVVLDKSESEDETVVVLPHRLPLRGSRSAKENLLGRYFMRRCR